MRSRPLGCAHEPSASKHSRRNSSRWFSSSESAAIGDIKSETAAATLLRLLDSQMKRELSPAIELDVLEAARRVSGNDSATARTIQERLAMREALLQTSADAVERRRECLEGGDAARGKKVYFEKADVGCVKCHLVPGYGGAVGPDLKGLIAKKDRRYILESILAPDRAVAEGFETTVVFQKDGQVATGVLKEETETTLRLLDGEARPFLIEKARIQSRTRGPSAMPEDIATKLSPSELRDVVEYVASLR